MKQIKVKISRNSRSLLLCGCQVLPCLHFSLVDHAILLPKTKDTKKIVKEQFNFAVFVLHLCLYYLNRLRDATKVKIILNRVLKYKLIYKKRIQFSVNINQNDPSNGKTALHYACIHSQINIVKHLLKSPGIDSTRLDSNGLPAQAYYFGCELLPSSNESKFRSLIAQKSKKLFNFLFYDKIPLKWSSTIFEHIEANFFFLMNEEQKRKIIHDIKDEKGNTLLHYAAKSNKSRLITIILNLNLETQFVTNLKGKLPIQYCKTNECFNLFNTTGQFYRANYFNANYFIKTFNNPIMYILFFFPEIVANHKKNEPYVCASLHQFVKYMLYLKSTEVKRISTFARDTMDNTLWHIIANMKNLTNKFKYYHMLDVSIIDCRNKYGDTALHLVNNKEEKKKLIALGAHADFINTLGCIAIQSGIGSEKTEIVMCPLLCLAARKVNPAQAPRHLKQFVQSHHAKKNELYYLNCIFK